MLLTYPSTNIIPRILFEKVNFGDQHIFSFLDQNGFNFIFAPKAKARM
jgi:hypothetical protein